MDGTEGARDQEIGGATSCLTDDGIEGELGRNIYIHIYVMRRGALWSKLCFDNSSSQNVVPDQQRQHHLGTWEKWKSSGPSWTY